jgi:hypothetical protein
MYDTEKYLFLLRRFDPFSGIAPLPLPNFQTTNFLNGADVSSTPNLQPGGQHTKYRTEAVWRFAQNLSSMGDPTGSYPAASTVFGVHLRHTSSVSAKYAFDKVGYMGTQGVIQQKNTVQISVSQYSSQFVNYS